MIRVTFNFGLTGIALALDFWILGYDPPAVKQVVRSNPSSFFVPEDKEVTATHGSPYVDADGQQPDQKICDRCRLKETRDQVNAEREYQGVENEG